MEEGEEIPNTYCRHGTYKGMNGTGVTRPDRAYCNMEAMLFVRQATTLYRDDNASHAILELDLDIQMFESRFRTLWRPMPFDPKALEGKQEKEQQEELEAEVWGGGQQEAYEDTIAAGDVEAAMAIWNHIAENFLIKLMKRRRAWQEASQEGGEAHDDKEDKKCRGRGRGPGWS